MYVYYQFICVEYLKRNRQKHNEERESLAYRGFFNTDIIRIKQEFLKIPAASTRLRL